MNDELVSVRVLFENRVKMITHFPNLVGRCLMTTGMFLEALGARKKLLVFKSWCLANY